MENKETLEFNISLKDKEFVKAYNLLVADKKDQINVNSRVINGATPLFFCIGIPDMHTELASLLIRKGADVNARSEEDISVAGQIIQTLHYLCNHGDCEIGDKVWKGAIEIANMVKKTGRLVLNKQDEKFVKKTINLFKEDDDPSLKKRLTDIFADF